MVKVYTALDRPSHAGGRYCCSHHHLPYQRLLPQPFCQRKSPTGGPEFKQHLVDGCLDGWMQEGMNWYRWFCRKQIKADSHKSAPSADLKRESWYTLGRQVSVIHLGSYTYKTTWEEDTSCFLKSWNNLCVQGWLKQKWWKCLSVCMHAVQSA